MKTAAMTPAELRDIRESLNLGTPRFGILVGCKNRDGSDVRKWERGAQNIPGPVVVIATALRDSRAVRRHFGVGMMDDSTPKSE